MLDTRSKLRKIDKEKRKHPRLELHCKALLRGLNGYFIVTDISLGGVFIEPQEPVDVQIGQFTDIKIKLPEASKSLQVKVRFVNQTKRGIGCEFINLSQAGQDQIKDCLETFRYTMPIRHEKEPTHKSKPKVPKKTIQCPQCKRVKSINLSSQNRRSMKVKLKCSCGHNWMLSFKQLPASIWLLSPSFTIETLF
jgi:DNA-directed RNA polymerase subunit M/transcription elongation factor TFIIS